MATSEQTRQQQARTRWLDSLTYLLASYDGGDGSYVRYNRSSLSSAAVDVFIEEDTTTDSETNHTTETVAYLAIEGDGTLTTTNEDAIITRSTYTAAGQPVAMRVSGHPDSDELYHIHADHLGSVAILTKYSDGYTYGNSRAYYYPFGAYRVEPGGGMTDRRFTGQRENMDWGLYYYNARYYVPGLGRFANADTIVPEPGDPQSFNRYSYVLNNPLEYTDPDGHCPAPTSENGYDGGENVICIAAFIPTAESAGPPGIVYQGDDRGFSENSGLSDSRFWAWIDADSGEIVESFVHPTVSLDDWMSFAAPLFGGECDDGVCTYPQPDWTANLQSAVIGDGVISFNYSVLCSHPTCYVGPGPDGSMLFIPNGQGSYDVAGLTEQFPNLEAYYWENGELTDTLFRINHFSQAELEADRLSFRSGWNMYGGIPAGEPTYYWDTFPWWRRGHLGH